jgi:hypothetical protein
MKKLGMLGVGALLAASVGCMVENEYLDGYDRGSVQLLDRDSFMYAGNLELNSGHMRGDVGTVRGIDANASYLTGYGDSDYATIEVHADGQRGVAMNLLEVYGGLDRLQPGTEATFRPDEGYYGGNQQLSVQLVNCAGPARYEWDSDDVAAQVTVRVTEPAPGVGRVEYTALTFDTDPYTGLQSNRASEVSGRFDFVR